MVSDIRGIGFCSKWATPSWFSGALGLSARGLFLTAPFIGNFLTFTVLGTCLLEIFLGFEPTIAFFFPPWTRTLTAVLRAVPEDEIPLSWGFNGAFLGEVEDFEVWSFVVLVVLDASEVLWMEKKNRRYFTYMYVKEDRDLYLMDKSYIWEGVFCFTAVASFKKNTNNFRSFNLFYQRHPSRQMFMCRLDREKKDTIFLTAWTLIPLTSTVFMLISVLASSAFSKQTIAYMSRQKNN